MKSIINAINNLSMAINNLASAINSRSIITGVASKSKTSNPYVANSAKQDYYFSKNQSTNNQSIWKEKEL